MRGGPRAGVALALVILMTLALAALAHAALVMTRTEGWVARSEGRRVEREYAAVAGVAWVAALDTLPSSGVQGTPYAPVRVHRLSPEVALLEAEDAWASGEGRGRLLWAPHPVERLRDRVAVLQLGGHLLAAPDAWVGPPAEPEGPCPQGAPLLPPWTRVVRPSHPGLGPAPLERLLERLSPLPGAVLDPGPLPDSTAPCPPGRGWGDPARPGGGCLGVWGEGGSPGSLRLEGWAQGVLVVQGDLVLAPQGRFRGWLWVGGDLQLEPGSVFSGVADVGGHLRVAGGARVEADACAGARALAAAPGLVRPWTLGPPAWPAF